MDLFTLGFLLIFLMILVKWLFTPDPPRKHGVYSQPNKWYWLKYVVFRLILAARKKQQRKVTGQNAGLGRKSRNSPQEMDRIQTLPVEHPKAVDAVYITGSNSSGQFLVTATARRHNNLVQTILFLRLPGTGLLELPCMPDTALAGNNDNKYSAGGLNIEPVIPMTKWTVSYQGKLRVRSTGKLLSVMLDLTWTACSDYFDFDTDMHPAAISDAVAREKWSRKLFDDLKQLHQTHYEQFGDLRGDVTVDGQTQKLAIRGVRDHSYGNLRDWRLLHRYALQYASLEDGTTLCVGAVSMPQTTSRLPIGYVILPDGQKTAVSWTDFEFHKLGDDGTPPTDFTIKFVAGGVLYTLQANVIETAIFYIGDGRDAKIHERFTKFSLNGIQGWGLSEWEYGNTDGTDVQNNMKVL